METETNISDMFQDDQNQGVMDAMGELAATIATSMAKYKADEQQLKDDKKLLDSMKTKLAEMMVANNCKNGHKFDNGCFVKPFVSTKIFKQAGVSDEALFAWLNGEELGDIIKPTVNWQTMNAALKERMASGKDLPDAMFNVSSEQTMKFSGNGHIKFLETLRKEGE
jgi:hypothetical protein